jgi:pimeloyl-ACP methyl ester carboxylesterase
LGWTSAYVSANGIRQHYTRTGGNKLPIVLLHGLTDNGLYWTTIAQGIEQDYDVIMPDARGHGLSEPYGEKSAWDDALEDVAGLIRELDLKLPGVIGHSMGAGTAGALAAQHPELVGCLILEDPPLFAKNPTPSPDSAEAHFAFDPWEQSLAGLKAKPRDEQLAIAQSEHPHWPEIELGRWVDTKNQFNLSTFNALTQPRPDWREIVSKIQCPVLLITGDPERGAIITPEIAQEAISLLPHGRVVRIADAGHSIRFDQHDAYLKVLTEFLHESYPPNP